MENGEIITGEVECRRTQPGILAPTLSYPILRCGVPPYIQAIVILNYVCRLNYFKPEQEPE